MKNSVFSVTDNDLIIDILAQSSHGTLALCADNIPYAVPVNFIYQTDTLYFHGSHKGRKADMLVRNPEASFSVIEPYSLIKSFYVDDEGLACPATQFFKSVIMSGAVQLIEDLAEKRLALAALMKKLQPEGGYQDFADPIYDKHLRATAVFKLVPRELSCKFKFGQQVSEARFNRIIQHLHASGTPLDLKTIALMQAQRDKS